MPTEKLMKELKKAHESYASARQETIGRSSRAQHAAKRAIFSVQRGDVKGAKSLLADARKELAAVAATAGTSRRLSDEGSYRAALEETAEAEFVLQLAEKGEVTALDGMDEETQIGGLCDALGEVVRLMVNAASAGDAKRAKQLKTAADKVMEGLVAMDFSGYLRTKFDQARGHMRRAEDVLYDLAMRGRGAGAK